MEANEDGDIVVQRITITRLLCADGTDGYGIEFDYDINMLADLGAIEAAKLALMDAFRHPVDVEDEEDE